MVLFLRLPLSSCVVRKAHTYYVLVNMFTPVHATCIQFVWSGNYIIFSLILFTVLLIYPYLSMAGNGQNEVLQGSMYPCACLYLHIISILYFTTSADNFMALRNKCIQITITINGVTTSACFGCLQSQPVTVAVNPRQMQNGHIFH